MLADRLHLSSAVSIRASTKPVIKQLTLATAISGCVLSGQSVNAQQSPSPIHQPLSDEYGVERKTGRASFPLPTIIAVGGTGEAQLAQSFNFSDGSYVSFALWPSLIVSEIVPPFNANGTQWQRYLEFAISYGSTTENFRILYANGGYSGTPTPEYPTGSTFIGNVFTNKHGMKITFSGTTRTVEYPNGLKVEYDNIAWSVKNNFGYSIKAEKNQTNAGSAFEFGTVRFQALNLAADYCDFQAVQLCANVSQNRQAKYEAVQDSSGGIPFAGRIELTDAAGGKTIVRNQLFSGYSKRPVAGNFGCYYPPIHHRAFPVGITWPSSTAETHTFQYSAQSSIPCGGLALDDIKMTGVVKDGVTVQYEPIRYAPGEAYGSYGGVSWFYLRSRINGQEVSYSTSFKQGEFWGQSRIALTLSRDALGRTTNYAFDTLFDIKAATYPEGNGVSRELDARYNINRLRLNPKANSGAPILDQIFTYEPTCTAATLAWCNKPRDHTDPKGNVTNYTYNDRGQVTVETKPAPSPGEPRPTVTNSYTLRTAYIKDASGNPVAAGPPISLLTRSSACRALATCAGTTDEVATEYDYGPTTGLNNLTLRGIAVTAVNDQGQMQTLRTCYQHNYFGEKIAETQPAAELAVCP